jgi:AraC family transcriptional regulator
MLIDLEAWRTRLPEGAAADRAAQSTLVRTTGGEGGFVFDTVTVGLVLRPLPSHRARYASDRMRATPLAAGEGWVFPAGVEGFCAWDSPHEFLNIALPQERFAAIGADPASVGRVGAGALDPLVVTLALQLHAAGPDQALYRDTLAATLAAHLVQSTPPPLNLTLDDARLKRVEDAIEADLSRAWSLDDLAALAAMSPFHFARSFKARSGAAPHQFLIGRRLARAKILLRTTGLPITEIAIRVGWENPSKFAAQFKKAAGCTPGQWRTG